MAGDDDLFSECRIAFVPSSTLTSKVISQHAELVEKYGGEVLEPKPSGRLAVEEATHIISDTIDFEDYDKAQALMVPVLIVGWIQLSLQRQRLAPLRPYSPDPRLFFHKVNVTCGDIPTSDRDAIIGATLALGGTESKDLGKLTTHICALSMDHPKCQIALEKKLKCKIVLPHWFDDCFKLGKRIDEGPYLLPNPEILRNDPGSSGVGVPSSEHMQGASTTLPDAIPEVRSRSLTVFNHKRIKLSTDQLLISSRFLNIVQDLITKGGGKLTDDVEECDMLICHYRDGSDYVRAAQTGKDVGNLSWLLYLIAHDQWTSPYRRLLHYPVPRDGIAGFKDLKITVSNYGGEARQYLETLITACGAEFTKTMKQDNTHLITARNNSEKCEAALDWGVSMVNHLWIEESYAKCELQNISVNPRFTHFPRRTNLSGIIGQTFLDEPTLHALYFPGGDDDEESVARRNRKVQDAAQENRYSVLEAPPQADDSMMDVDDASEQADPNSRTSQTEQPDNGESTTRRTRKRKSPDLPPLGVSNKTAFATPARSSRRVGIGKENDTPSSERAPGSRSAKDKAIAKLHDQAPDIALWQKENKRTAKDGHAPWGGKRATTEFEKQQGAASAAQATAKEKQKGQRQQHSEDDDDAEAAPERPNKKQRQSLPPVQYRVCVTMFKRWQPTTGRDNEDNERRKLRRMGIHIVQEGQPCDYLAAPRVIRTQKFLVSMARGPEVVDLKFIEDALDTGKLPDPDDYLLEDPSYPDLRQFVARARSVRGKLLNDVPVYCTEKIQHGFTTFKTIAEANGAIFKIYRASSGCTIKPTTAEEDGGLPPDPVYLISGDSEAEKKLWPRFEEMAHQGHMEPFIVQSDWLLDVCMQQKIFLEDSHRQVQQGGNNKTGKKQKA